MKYLTKKPAALLMFGCWFIYVTAYVGRLNYSASMATIITELGLTNDKGGTIYSCFALAYGIGQLVNGLLCKYYNPKHIITGALGVSALTNLLMPLSGDWRVMAGLWLVNGIVQSMLYSLIIRTISKNICSGSLNKAIYILSTTVATGTSLAYGISALFVALDVWEMAFFTASALLLIAAVVWFCIMLRVEKAHKTGDIIEEEASAATDTAPSKKNRMGATFILTLSFIGISAIANGFIKDGVNNWLPKLLQDEFSVDDSLSVILTLLLPVFSIFGALFARKVYLKLRNHLLVNGIFYSIAFVLALGVYFIYPIRSVLLTMVLFIGLAYIMAAVNNVITSMFPLDNRERMDSGFLAGLLDALCYVGSSAAGILLGAMSQNSGWTSVLISLFVLSAVAAAACFVWVVLAKKHNLK